MKITIITIGKLKEQYWRDAEAEYLKRLSAFAKIDIKEIKEEKFSEKDNLETIKQKEAEKIMQAIPKDSYIIALDKDGQQYTSEDFSKQIQQFESRQWSGLSLRASQYNNITLIIGGPLGLTDELKQRSNELLSFSKSTFTHQMIRVILLEQIYRGYMIKENRKYHY